MSTYYNPHNGKNFRIDKLEAPAYVKDWLNHLLVVENLAPRTVNTYYTQLRSFLRWAIIRENAGTLTAKTIADQSIKDIPFELLAQMQTTDLYEFLSFAGSELSNNATSRSLKLTAVKSFYEYQWKIVHRMEGSPAQDITSPKLEKHMPRFLTADESIRLLEAISGENAERDYCMVTFLLNCGMRLSELVAINTTDIRDGQLRLFGKGRKERIVYLNAACKAALASYLDARALYRGSEDTTALFISNRTGARLTGRRVEQIVEHYLLKAGLAGQGYSPHKLRHTAATLMYQDGGADVLTLKEILGHENIATTEIYTHINQQQIKTTMENSPLANITRDSSENN